jgi:hypothetical protein
MPCQKQRGGDTILQRRTLKNQTPMLCMVQQENSWACLHVLWLFKLMPRQSKSLIISLSYNLVSRSVAGVGCEESQSCVFSFSSCFCLRWRHTLVGRCIENNSLSVEGSGLEVTTFTTNSPDGLLSLDFKGGLAHTLTSVAISSPLSGVLWVSMLCF